MQAEAWGSLHPGISISLTHKEGVAMGESVWITRQQAHLMATSPDQLCTGCFDHRPTETRSELSMHAETFWEPHKKVEKTGNNRFYLVQYMQIIISNTPSI